MLHTNHFINMCSCSWRKPMWRLLGWLTFLYRTVKVNWTKCPWKNFSHREISSNALINYSVQFSMDCSMPGFPVHHQLLEITQTHVHRVGDLSNHLNLCHPLLLLPSIVPRIRVFSNESVICIRWPKYWSFSFSISPSNEYSGLISFRWTGWISLQSKGLSRVFSNTTVQKHQFFHAQLSL